MAYMNPRLFLLLLLALFAATGVSQVSAQQSETRVALVIGNADYPDADAPLKDLLNNARAFAEELRRQGFDVDTGENLTKEAMRTAIERFYGKIKSGSAALIFFSGYGIQSNRQTYIVPVNAQIWTEPDVRRDGYSLDSVLAEMNSKGARIKIAILDASRRNPYERRFRSVPAGLAPVIAPNNTAVMYAAAPSMVVRDGDRPLFVGELLKAIRAPGKIDEVFNRTLSSVSRESRGEQAPWFSSSLVEEFSFVQSARLQPGPATEKTPEPARPPAVSPADNEANAQRDYQSAERLGTRKAWEDFIAKYPSGRYADLARDRLAKLAPPAVQPKPPDSEANAQRDYQSTERVGTRKAWEDFIAKHPSGRYSDLARDRLARLDPAPARPTPSVPAVTPAVPETPAKPDARLDDPAIQDLDKRIQLNSNDAAAYYKRGQLYAQHGDFHRAIKDFDQTIRLNPKDAEALNNRCWARAVVGELQPALKDCNDALQIRPRYFDALDSRGFINLKLGQPSRALADYDLALQINSKHASALYGRGIAKLRVGNTAAGNNDIAAAKAIQPDIAEEFAGYGVRQ
jgi:tetratricopeptide (TPR) repeat protein